MPSKSAKSEAYPATTENVIDFSGYSALVIGAGHGCSETAIAQAFPETGASLPVDGEISVALGAD